MKAKVERELQGRSELPKGTFFSLGYDPEGNFGLILSSKGTEMAVPPLLSTQPQKETVSY